MTRSKQKSSLFFLFLSFFFGGRWVVGICTDLGFKLQTQHTPTTMLGDLQLCISFSLYLSNQIKWRLQKGGILQELNKKNMSKKEEKSKGLSLGTNTTDETRSSGLVWLRLRLLTILNTGIMPQIYGHGGFS